MGRPDWSSCLANFFFFLVGVQEPCIGPGSTNFRTNQSPPWVRPRAAAQGLEISTSRRSVYLHATPVIAKRQLSPAPRTSHHTTTMAMSCRYAARSCARQLRSAASPRTSAQMLRVSSTTRRYNSTEAAAAPTNPKIAEIVEQISQLTLLETADLVTSLKVRQ